MMKLPETSATAIAIIFLFMNLSKILKKVLCLFLRKNLFCYFMIIQDYNLNFCDNL